MSINKLFIGLLVLVGFLSCDNDINIAADFENIPVVFALIDAGEEVNYFRIERAFIDEDISPEILAQNQDSVFYGTDIQASVTNLRNNETVILQRVNLEDEGIVREDGPFITSPNIGYRLNVADLRLELNDMISFQLVGPNEQVFTEATTTVVGEHTIGNSPPEAIRFRYDREATLNLRTDDQAAVFYDLRMIINYTEENINNPGVVEERALEWLVVRELERGESSSGNPQSQTTFRVEDGEDFYQFLSDNIPEDPNIIRNFVHIDLQYDAGGQELFDFINIGLANTGITSGQIIPSFTNLSNGAVGLFSSRITTRSTIEYVLDGESRDSLRDSRLTAPLNFN